MRDPLDMNEIACAKVATRVVADAGGYLSFGDYDRKMNRVQLFAPIAWCQGWGDPLLLKRNQRTLAAFAAVIEGMLEQTSTGYRLPHEGSM